MKQYARTLGDSFFFRGICIFLIIVFHTINLFEIKQSSISSVFLLLSSFKESINAVLFIASGIGFASKDIEKTFKQYAKYILIPYCITALFTSLIHLIVHYATFKWFPGAVSETIKLLKGYILGLACTYEFSSGVAYSCGPIWFLLTLFISWNILNIITNKIEEKYQTIAVFTICIFGSLIYKFSNFPLFCLPQSMVSVFYLYVGYFIKNNKLINVIANKKFYFIVFISALLVLVPSVIFQRIDSISEMNLNLGILSVISHGIIGTYIYLLFMKIKLRKKITSYFFGYIGKNSRDIICFHTIEFHAIPWYLLADFFNNSILGFLVIIVARIAIILSLGLIVKYYKKIKRSRSLKNRITQKA